MNQKHKKTSEVVNLTILLDHTTIQPLNLFQILTNIITSVM